MRLFLAGVACVCVCVCGCVAPFTAAIPEGAPDVIPSGDAMGGPDAEEGGVDAGGEAKAIAPQDAAQESTDGGAGVDASADEDAGIDAPIDAPGDTYVCTPIAPDAGPLVLAGCVYSGNGAFARPTFFQVLYYDNPGQRPDAGGCGVQNTPAVCQCAETYDCACVAQNPTQACSGMGSWHGCTMQQGIPSVTCVYP